MLNSAALGACSLLGIATAGMMWFWQDDAALAAAAREQAVAERAHAEAARAHAEEAVMAADAGQQLAEAAVHEAHAAQEHAVHAQEVARAYSHSPGPSSQGGSWSTQGEQPTIYGNGTVNVAGFPLTTTLPGQAAYRFLGVQQPESGAGEALAAYREADTDEERDEAKTKLSEALGEEYDAILEQHAKHLAQMEERLEKLRGQLEKRRDARDDMVEMRVEALTSEADGLGWPSPPNGPQHVWGMPLFAPAAPATPSAASMPALPGVDILPAVAPAAPADAPEPNSRPARRPRSGGRPEGSR